MMACGGKTAVAAFLGDHALASVPRFLGVYK